MPFPEAFRMPFYQVEPTKILDKCKNAKVVVYNQKKTGLKRVFSCLLGFLLEGLPN